MFDMPFFFFLLLLIQSTILQLFKYLACITSFHVPWVKSTLHKFFVAKALPKRKIFLMPQPPNSLGLARFSHLTRWNFLLSLWLDQRKLKILFLWLNSKYPLGFLPRITSRPKYFLELIWLKQTFLLEITNEKSNAQSFSQFS